MSLEENTQSKITKRAIAVTLILIGGFFILFKEPKPYIYGLVFGVSINLLNFRLLALSMEKAMDLPPHRVMPYVVANYMARYLIYGVVLAVAAMADYLSIYTAILGIFMVKLIILSDTFYDMIRGVDKEKHRT